MFFGLFPSKTEPPRTRYVVGTREERTTAQQKLREKRTEVEAQLGVYCAQTSVEDRQFDTALFFAVASNVAEKQKGRR